jgi:transcriptional regulator of acetoin/glycerol metabolism
LALVRSAARMIEDRVLLSDHTPHVRLRLHAQVEGLDCLGAGLVALTDDGWIVGTNSVARTWLGLHTGDVAATVSATLGVSVAELLANAGRPRLVQSRAGGRLWLRTDLPAPRAFALRVDSPPSRTDEDPRVSRARERAARALAAGLTVLLQGESGTGKDVFARALHESSARRKGPFVAVNCAALPESLVEAELFGYVAGAFTGARREGAPGRFREAHGGTLFLDEIGDMPLLLQTRLLRVIEERRVTPLGSGHAVPVDVQLIGASHHDLQAAVAAGRFRSDLYYRLAGFSVRLPALRERGDFDALCAAMVRDLRPDSPPRLASDLHDAMRTFSWPGNLRQLRSLLTVALAMLDPRETVIGWEHVPDDLRAELCAPSGATRTRPPQDLRALSDRAITDAVAATGHNMSEAARRLGISRNTLYRRLRRIHG